MILLILFLFVKAKIVCAKLVYSYFKQVLKSIFIKINLAGILAALNLQTYFDISIILSLSVNERAIWSTYVDFLK